VNEQRSTSRKGWRTSVSECVPSATTCPGS
jgi:hypothetical protein